MDIRICGRGIDLTDGLRDCVNEKLTDALKVFDIEPCVRRGRVTC